MSRYLSMPKIIINTAKKVNDIDFCVFINDSSVLSPAGSGEKYKNYHVVFR